MSLSCGSLISQLYFSLKSPFQTSVHKDKQVSGHTCSSRARSPEREQHALRSSRDAEVVTEETQLIPHTMTVPASNRLIAGRVIGRKDCPALYPCVCNYVSSQGDKCHDWFLSAGFHSSEMGGLSAEAVKGAPDHKQNSHRGTMCSPPLSSSNSPPTPCAPGLSSLAYPLRTDPSREPPLSLACPCDCQVSANYTAYPA